MPATYLVTGASRGLGRQFVLQLAARGDRVIAAARSRDSIADLPGQHIELDVSDPASIERAASSLAGQPIDVLINNAGVTAEDKSLAKVDAATFARVFATNVAAPALVSKALLPNIAASSRRMIVNISSQLGSLTKAMKGFSYAYCSSKAAVNMVTIQMAAELKKDRVTVVTFHPGWVKTDMGGPEAPLEAIDAIASMIQVFDRLTIEDTGKFINYNGAPMAW